MANLLLMSQPMMEAACFPRHVNPAQLVLQARSSAGEAGDGQNVRTISGDYYASLPAILRTRTGGTLEVCTCH